MGFYDQHVHSRHSCDSPIEPREAVLRALELGLSGLTFTEHYDTHPEDWPTCRYDDDAYNADIAELREEFSRDITIGKGIEVCYQPDRMNSILDFLAARDFDVVLLSVHWTAVGAIHDRNCWDGKTAEEMSRDYLAVVLRATEMCVRMKQQGGHPFNVLGHLDLVRRYAVRFLRNDDPIGHSDLVDTILRNCLEADLVPEINTSSLRQGLAEPMPGETVIRRYAELGGTAMVLGSDAHNVEHVGAGLSQVAALARHCGIDRLAVFNNRRKKTLPMARGL